MPGSCNGVLLIWFWAMEACGGKSCRSQGSTRAPGNHHNWPLTSGTAECSEKMDRRVNLDDWTPDSSINSVPVGFDMDPSFKKIRVRIALLTVPSSPGLNLDQVKAAHSIFSAFWVASMWTAYVGFALQWNYSSTKGRDDFSNSSPKNVLTLKMLTVHPSNPSTSTISDIFGSHMS